MFLGLGWGGCGSGTESSWDELLALEYTLCCYAEGCDGPC